MSRMKFKTVLIILMFLVLGTFGASIGRAITVSPGDGLIFSQIDLAYTGISQSNSSYGLAAVDINTLTTNAGISSGYLNIETSAGWVVRNMPIDLSSGYPGISSVFDIGVSAGTDISSLGVIADFSSNPTVSFIGGAPTLFGVGDVSYNAEGRGVLRTDLPTNSVDASVINFQLGGLVSSTWQPGHPSIEQDKGQCGPASAANSLQWIEDTYGINIKHSHKAGLGDNKDGTLVSELDQDMLRAENTLIYDDEFIDGKLEYISDNTLGNLIRTKHKATNRTIIKAKDVTKDVSNEGLTSKVDTSILTLTEWIQQEVDNGEDVELAVGWGNNQGHWVDLIGAGSVLGVPWVAWTHDAFQDVPGGNNWFDGGIGWSPVINDKLIMFIEGKFEPATLDLVVSESPVPEPATMLLLGSGLIGLLGFRKKLRNKQS